jgi:hypothetical protein
MALVVFTAEPGSLSQHALDLLAGRTVTSGQEERSSASHLS